MLNAEQRSWAKRLEKLLNAMPAGIELVVGQSEVAVLEAGFYKREILGSDIDMMNQGAQLIEQHALHEFAIDGARIRPNSESI
ncbi:hypothetical protein R70006_05066 [Paraburkholderia domus]|uniref:hypothetical protein n=1 Tax=Paraburkholderia domus TaxID=2793075 RepID=UPI0019115B37|nr:hypothetical protein [Paraburkholderia domus]MBK5051697.1 hypothetical protein [Burkholderia sp. R-70006]CAE6795766.1 hypothetical protein R70006_05066 [Paraburkholderia domus]